MNVISNIKTYLRIVFISFEFLFTIIMGIIYQLKLSFFKEFGIFIYSSNDIITFFTLAVPASIFVYSLTVQKALLQPQDKIEILVKWPDYDEYKKTTYVGLSFCALPIIPSLISWMRKSIYVEYDIGFYYLLLLGVSIISIFSLYAAQYKVIEVINKYE